MEKILKNVKIIGIILTILLTFTMNVYAANNDSFKTTISANNSQVKRGEIVTVTIGLKDIAIESGEKGIGAYTASVKFDSSVLEYSKTDSTANWEAPFYQGGQITGNTKNGEVVKSTGSIGTITFKVKEDAKLGETTISLTNFSGSTAVTDVITADVSVKITVIDSNNGNNSGNGGSGNNNPSDNGNGGNSNPSDNGNNGNGGNSNPSNNGNSGSNGSGTSNTGNTGNKGNSNTVVDNSIKEGKLPKTGKNDIALYITIGACTVLAIVFFIRMQKLNV